MQYLQYMSFASRGNDLNSHIKVYRFCHFLKFRLKNVFRKVKISQRRKKVATNFDIFSESSKHYLSPLTPSFFPYFKASCRKIHFVSSFSQNRVKIVITRSLKSHVPHLVHLITLFEAIPIDQVSILYGCWDIVAQFHKENPKNTKFLLSITQKSFIEFIWNFYSLLVYHE